MKIEKEQKKLVLCKKFEILVRKCKIYGCEYHIECEKAL
jgi:hypothetical protein